MQGSLRVPTPVLVDAHHLEIKSTTAFPNRSRSLRENEPSRTAHVGDFRRQLRWTCQNRVARKSENAGRKHVVRTACYLRAIDRDYAVFNEEPTWFFKEQALVVIEAVAIFLKE